MHPKASKITEMVLKVTRVKLTIKLQMGCLVKRWRAGETLLIDSSFDGAWGSRLGLVLPLDVVPFLLFSSRAGVHPKPLAACA